MVGLVSMQLHNVETKPPPFAVQLDHIAQVPVQVLFVRVAVVLAGFVASVVFVVMVEECPRRLRFFLESTVTVVAGRG